MLKKCLLMTLLCFYPLSTNAQKASESPLITVSAEAEVKVVPDEVVFELEVETIDKDLVTAKAQNDERVKKILDLARGYQIAPQLIQTDYISIEPRYEFEGGRREDDDDKPLKRTFIGFVVSKEITVVLKDLTRFDNLLSEIVRVGITRISNVQFRSTRIREFRSQARLLAMNAAQDKARAMTREIGQEIGKAVSIREGGIQDFNQRMPPNVTTIIQGTLTDNDSSIAPGQISVKAVVTVSFELK